MTRPLAILKRVYNVGGNFDFIVVVTGTLVTANYWPDCKPEGPLFSYRVCLSVCLSVCVSLTGTSILQRRPILIKLGYKGPYCDLVWPRP